MGTQRLINGITGDWSNGAPVDDETTYQDLALAEFPPVPRVRRFVGGRNRRLFDRFGHANTHNVNPLAGIEPLQQQLRAIAESDRIAMGICFGSQLREHHVFGGADAQFTLNAQGDITKQQLSSRRNADGAVSDVGGPTKEPMPGTLRTGLQMNVGLRRHTDGTCSESVEEKLFAVYGQAIVYAVERVITHGTPQIKFG